MYRRKTEFSTIENVDLQDSNCSFYYSELETYVSTQEQAEEQIQTYIKPIKAQLEDLTRLTQGLTKPWRQILPKAPSIGGRFTKTGKLFEIELP